MTTPTTPSPFPDLGPDPPDVPAAELLRVARLNTQHRVEVVQAFETGGPTWEVRLFDLPEEGDRHEINRVSDALVDFCQDHNWFACFYVARAPEWVPSAPQK